MGNFALGGPANDINATITAASGNNNLLAFVGSAAPADDSASILIPSATKRLFFIPAPNKLYLKATTGNNKLAGIESDRLPAS